MKYYLKENFRFLYADGQLYDEDDNIAYEFQNQTLMFPQIDLYRNGEAVGHIKKRFSWFLEKYDIYHYDNYVDSLNQQFRFFRSELILERLNWTVKGDFFSWHYEILNEYGELIARVDQELFRLTQRFFIEIFDERNEDLVILIVLAINQFDKDRQAAASSSAAN